MSIEAYVTFQDVDTVNSLKIGEEELLATLATPEEALAVKLRDLFDSVMRSVTPSIRGKSQLNVEVSGTVNLKTSGGISYLFFNIGGEAGKASTMKVSLSTELTPQ